MSSNGLESATSNEGHSSSGIGFRVVTVGKDEETEHNRN